MTEERDLIQQYLDRLRLSLRIPEVGRILVEAEDHLRAATAAKVADGLTERQAQEAAIAAFGPVHAIVYAHQTRNGRIAAVLADLGISAWRVIAFYLVAAAVVAWAVWGLAGVGMIAAYFAVRRFQRRRGRVWSIPLGGFFPLAAAVGSVAVGVTMLMLSTTSTAHIPDGGAVVYLALGMTVTYGWRMLRMLWQQQRDHEVA